MSLSYLKSSSVNRIHKGIVHGKLFHCTLSDLSLNIFFIWCAFKRHPTNLFKELHGAVFLEKSIFTQIVKKYNILFR